MPRVSLEVDATACNPRELATKIIKMLLPNAADVAHEDMFTTDFSDFMKKRICEKIPEALGFYWQVRLGRIAKHYHHYAFIEVGDEDDPNYTELWFKDFMTAEQLKELNDKIKIAESQDA